MKKRKVEPGISDQEFRAIRAELGLIIPRFGELLGVGRGTAADWSRGENRPSGSAVRFARLYVRLHRVGGCLRPCRHGRPVVE